MDMAMKLHLKSLARSFQDLFFPRICAGCLTTWLSTEYGFWCEDCLGELPWIRSPLCPCCGRPFFKSELASDHLCGECVLKTPPFAAARSAVQHAGFVRDRINQLKFGGQLHWAPPLAQLLEEAVRYLPDIEFDYIVPVPLHIRRLRQRGFNQAGLIARMLGKSLQSRVRFDVLIRRQWTEPQTRLSREERLRNVKRAFSVAAPSEVVGRRILLIDDVFTTGTTLVECCKTLKKAGASEVHAVTVTRSLPEMRMDLEETGKPLEL